MEKEKGSNLVIAVVTLVLMVLALGGYLVYDKMLKPEPEVEQPTQASNTSKTFRAVGQDIKKVSDRYSSVAKKEIGILVTDKEYMYLKLYEYYPAGSPKITLVIVNEDAEEIFREVIHEAGQSLELEQNDSSTKLYANENYYITTDAVFFLSNNFSCTNNVAKEYKITVNNNTVTKTEVTTHSVTVAGSCS